MIVVISHDNDGRLLTGLYNHLTTANCLTANCQAAGQATGDPSKQKKQLTRDVERVAMQKSQNPHANIFKQTKQLQGTEP